MLVLLAVDPAEQSGGTVFHWIAKRPPVTKAVHDKSFIVKLNTGAVWASARGGGRHARRRRPGPAPPWNGRPEPGTPLTRRNGYSRPAA
ncbi:hypothetical protein BHS06_02735 [Myxococcus xanthus]|nr:hypothetical protein BHS06_02735 [Myxococcus xanthus]